MTKDINVKPEDIKRQLDELQERRDAAAVSLLNNQALADRLRSMGESFTSLKVIYDNILILEKNDHSYLLWGDKFASNASSNMCSRIKSAIEKHDASINDTRQRNTRLKTQIRQYGQDITRLRKLYRQHLTRTRAGNTIKGTRIPVYPAPAKPVVLPWSNQYDDEIRLRAIMISALFITLLFIYIIPGWEVHVPDDTKRTQIPERLATIITIRHQPKPPPTVPEQSTTQEKKQTDEPERDQAEATSSDARKVAERSGILAYKEDLAQIMNASSGLMMGSNARITNSASHSGGTAGRALIYSQIELPRRSTSVESVKRTEVITGDNNLKMVEYARIEHAAPAVEDDRQAMQDTARVERSDEEIQLVFDRYKSALYRIYNRELRKNPFLKGKLVLKLTIEEDGSVSNCSIKTSELKAEDLESKIIARVLNFNFGAKKGASALTIFYPINFLPAS